VADLPLTGLGKFRGPLPQKVIVDQKLNQPEVAIPPEIQEEGFAVKASTPICAAHAWLEKTLLRPSRRAIGRLDAQACRG
jgi:hypothetical protein